MLSDNYMVFNFHSLKKENYEELVTGQLKRSVILDHTKSPCDEDFIPNTSNQPYLLFIRMENHKDYSTWLQIAKVWDKLKYSTFF